MATHARLSPSDAERWISCPASLSMDALLPIEEVQQESVYAREGTCAHGLGELKASLAFGQITAREFEVKRKKWHKQWLDFTSDKAVLREIDRHTDAYVVLLEQLAGELTACEVFLEQKLNTGIAGCWGTSDAILVSVVDRVVHSVDFKYGSGVAVEAEGNPQLRLYALGALEEHDILGDIETVRMTVHQPRMNHVLTAEMTADEIREWREEIRPIAREALGGSDRFGPSANACRWCPSSGRCMAQVEQVFSIPFEDPRELQPEQIAEYLEHVPVVRQWLADFEATALHRAYSEGTPIPGWKVIRSGGQRRFSDPDGAVEHLTTVLGYEIEEVVNTKIKGIGDLESLIGTLEFEEHLAQYITKDQGKESLVPESDKREAVSPNTEAMKVFTDLGELA